MPAYTTYDILAKQKAMLVADSALDAWAVAEFGKSFSVSIDNVPLKTLGPEKLPAIFLAPLPGESPDQQDTVSDHYFHEKYGAGIVIYDSDPEAGCRLLYEAEPLVVNALLNDANGAQLMDGRADYISVVDRVPDAGANHPKHSMSIHFAVMREGNY